MTSQSAEQQPMPEPAPMTKEEATEFFAVIFHGEHHIPSDVKPFGRGWKINAHAERLSTYDYGEGLEQQLRRMCQKSLERESQEQRSPESSK